MNKKSILMIIGFLMVMATICLVTISNTKGEKNNTEISIGRENLVKLEEKNIFK